MVVDICLREYAQTDIVIVSFQLPSGCSTQNLGDEMIGRRGEYNEEMSSTIMFNSIM